MVSPYQTAIALGRPAPSYISDRAAEDKERVWAYTTYDDIYANVPEAFGNVLRSDDDPKSRRYIPYGRAIVEATNRYLAKDLTISYEIPLESPATPEQQAELKQFVEGLLTRESFMTKFAEVKRDMLKRGDGFFQVSADATKPEGSRIRITVLDGSQYFPIKYGNDPERIAGVYIITLLTAADGNTVVAQREWFQKILTEEDVAAAGPGATIGGIFYKMEFFERDGWDDRFPLSKNDLKPVPPPDWIKWTEAQQLAMQGIMLPDTITSIPIYHFPNVPKHGMFGVSLLQGTETILAGITQNVTDEDLAVALAGIGVYWTDSGSPKGPNGEDLEWNLAPASVMELTAGRKFGRVEGITTVQPMQDHIGSLKDAALETTGTPDIAVGKVDVQVAESGVALAIKMAPVLSGNSEREDVIRNKLEQMLYDILNGWAPAYEGRQPIEGSFIVNVSFGDPMPTDRAATLEEVRVIVESKIADAQWAREYLSEKLGFTFPDDIAQRMAAAAQQELDAEAARLEQAAASLATPGE